MTSIAPPPFLRRAETPELRAHQQWLGYVQPVGLVVSIPALEKAQAYVNRNVLREQQTLIRLSAPDDEPAYLTDLPAFVREVLGWEDGDLVGAPGGRELPAELDVALPEYGEVLRPTYAVPDPDASPDNGRSRWLMLVQELPRGAGLDASLGADHKGWQASPQARLERMLRENDVPVGLLCNEEQLRLVYAPRGESSGHISFSVAAMCEPAGRPILGGLHMLLAADRLFSLPQAQRLPAILKDSRKYQNEVSTALSEQVLAALHELLRGFEAADRASHGALLGDVLREAPKQVYGGLLATLLRLVFILYAEDRGLMPEDPVYQRHYALTGLFEKLREDAARFPDTMDQRFGAWARVLTLFRLIHDGGRHGTIRFPERDGRLFDPDAYPFLEGRPYQSVRVVGERLAVPKVSDGVVYRVLENLLLLKGDRLSYRALDVEQIGSVYEAMMGFALEVVTEPSIAVRPHHVVVGLGSLLAVSGAERLKRLADKDKGGPGCKVTGKSQDAVKKAKTVEELVAALGKSVSPRTPEVLQAGSLVLQPTEERRRSGSHYTPRSLTEPIVETALRPVLEDLGPKPTPDQLLALKVCDPAMGSGAFLVAACRALGDRLVDAWQRHGMPSLPPDEDPVLHARRLVAQRCLYGVDKNPFAVDLAKLSLWLVTLAKDHPFTFLDHALQHGDSLVGLGREQIASFTWTIEHGLKQQVPLIRSEVDRALQRAVELRLRIHALASSDDMREKRELLREADDALAKVRRVGDLVVEAYFTEATDKARKRKLGELAGELAKGLEKLPEAVEAERLTPFHWEIEFPEVFARENPGFDCVVGNPPFAGKNTLTAQCGDVYIDWLKAMHEGAHGNSDLVAHFFRRAFRNLRTAGTLGLIATNTIAQGDTRGTGLRWICKNRGVIYEATRRYKWPGLAAVIVSVVHIARAPRRHLGPRLDGRRVERISAFLFHRGGDDDPAVLKANAGKSFQGSIVLGMGFTFDDSNEAATPIAEMRRLIEKDPRNAERIFPYLGGEELNSSPTHAHHRYVINFGQMSEDEARRWPDLMSIVETKVKPSRLAQNREARARYWWRFGEVAPALYDAIREKDRVMVIARVSQSAAFAFLPANLVFSEQVVVMALGSDAAMCTCQGRIHETWARFFASSMKDDLRYTPSDCFETFPFPPGWETDSRLEEVGRAYYEFRASLMVRNNEGLTATYNRFHDPDERDADILKLRDLHDAMDRAVLDAYGWTDIRPSCGFLLDYEEEDDGEEDEGRARKRKKPWRYRWPDEVRDEVLARLLALNAERAEEEKRLGAEAGMGAVVARTKKGRKKKGGGGLEGQGGLW